MPGTIWIVKCPKCKVREECVTGVSRCREHNDGSCYSGRDQYGCASCGAIVSVSTCMTNPDPNLECPRCQGVLSEWAGQAGFFGEKLW